MAYLKKKKMVKQIEKTLKKSNLTIKTDKLGLPLFFDEEKLKHIKCEEEEEEEGESGEYTTFTRVVEVKTPDIFDKKKQNDTNTEKKVSNNIIQARVPNNRGCLWLILFIILLFIIGFLAYKILS